VAAGGRSDVLGLSQSPNSQPDHTLQDLYVVETVELSAWWSSVHFTILQGYHHGGWGSGGGGSGLVELHSRYLRVSAALEALRVKMMSPVSGC
jgi:hypothetical protein